MIDKTTIFLFIITEYFRNLSLRLLAIRKIMPIHNIKSAHGYPNILYTSKKTVFVRQP